MSETPSTSSEKKPLVAVVGIVGRTNAGKSTLVNRLVGEKISIVSPVEQTTRNTVRGIVADSRGQLVLLDTPGIHKAQGHLNALSSIVWRAEVPRGWISSASFLMPLRSLRWRMWAG